MRYISELFISFFLIVVLPKSYSQGHDTIDFNTHIKSVTNDSTSDYFYSRLVEKVRNHPSQLDAIDCYYLYYGQIFQKEYFMSITIPERVNFDKEIMNSNYQKAYGIGIVILEKSPVDLIVLLHVNDCIKKKNYVDTTYFIQYRLHKVLDAILSTGDGKSIETAIKIIDPEHDYVIKGILGFLGGKEMLEFKNNRMYSVWEKGGQKLYFEDIIVTR